MSTQSHILRHSAIAIAVLAAGMPTAATAATLTWPNLSAFGPCRSTLQACLDEAASGDIVQIGVDDLFMPDRYTLVDENVSIRKSLTLRSVVGIDAVFAAGRSITVNPPFAPLVAYTVAVEGVTLDRGRIQVSDVAALSSVYRVERVRFNGVIADQCAITMTSAFGTVPEFQAFRNVIRVGPSPGTLASGVCINTGSANRSLTLAGNRIEAPNGGMRRGISISGGSAGPVRISANTIVGREFPFGIEVQQPVSTERAMVQVLNNSVSGQNSDSGLFAGGIRLVLSNADVQVINNTVVDGFRGLSIDSFNSAPALSGLVANNLVAYHDSDGMVIFNAGAVENRNNLVFGNFTDQFVPGPGTVTVDPQLISLTYPRPRGASAAINAGSNSALPVFNFFDADGQPRTLMATVDIGAFEAGFGLTGVHVATQANSFFNQTDLSSLAGVALAPSAILGVTSLRAPGMNAALAQNVGVWLPSGTGNLPLSIYHENSSVVMPLGRRFAVTVPGFGLNGFTHLTALGNITAQYSQMTNPALDGRPDAIAVVTHNYFNSGPAHNFAIGLEYAGTRWNLRNEDASVDMSSGRGFNVVIAPQISENAYRVVAQGSGPSTEIPISHPLLDDNACAAPIVGRVDVPGGAFVFNPTAFSVDYRPGVAGAPGRWFVVAENGGSPASFPAGSAFNVIIDGAQANGCRAPVRPDVFRNGFE